jgi:hypothetical protein
VSATSRNVVVLAVTVVTILLLMLYPTSTNRSGQHRRPGEPLAPAGVVTTTPHR